VVEISNRQHSGKRGCVSGDQGGQIFGHGPNLA
jgi:hypothetical protein